MIKDCYVSFQEGQVMGSDFKPILESKYHVDLSQQCSDANEGTYSISLDEGSISCSRSYPGRSDLDNTYNCQKEWISMPFFGKKCGDEMTQTTADTVEECKTKAGDNVHMIFQASSKSCSYGNKCDSSVDTNETGLEYYTHRYKMKTTSSQPKGYVEMAMTHTKCGNATNEAAVESKEACESLAVSRNHPFYSYSNDENKACSTSETCTFKDKRGWPFKVYNKDNTTCEIKRGDVVYKGCNYVYQTEEEGKTQCGSVSPVTFIWDDTKGTACELKRLDPVYEGCGLIYQKESDANAQCGGYTATYSFIPAAASTQTKKDVFDTCSINGTTVPCSTVETMLNHNVEDNDDSTNSFKCKIQRCTDEACVLDDESKSYEQKCKRRSLDGSERGPRRIHRGTIVTRVATTTTRTPTPLRWECLLFARWNEGGNGDDY